MKENSICGDNRFEIIEKAKEMLLNATNIEDSKEEMKVLTNILFRMWQVGLINEEKLEINKLQKENSTEENIKLLEEFSNENVLYGSMVGMTLEKYKDLQLSAEHILSDYKRVLKENEEYSKQLDLDYVDKNYISKQKIKDEIEELKGKLEDISRRREKSKTKEEETVLWCLEIRVDERIKTLQELL